MSAPKTKKSGSDSENRKGVQLIVFAPINADPKDEENRIYMLCPSSLKVVEVIEKFDEEADEFLALLGKHKKKTTQSSEDFADDLDSLEEISDDMIEDNSGSAAKSSSSGSKPEIKTLESELDDDVVTFASAELSDIFPEEGDESKSKYSETDLADALALLDEEDDESDLKDLGDFKGEDDALPSL